MDPASRSVVLATAILWIVFGFAGLLSRRDARRTLLGGVLVFLGVAAAAVSRSETLVSHGERLIAPLGVVVVCLLAMVLRPRGRGRNG